MKIAVEGCAHGELEKIYDTLQHLEISENVKIDLLICCGDFQSARNLNDLKCMAVPEKYQNICTFYKYFSGEKVAPILTIFIGGNHEASNYLQELPYGGWVAPNIYYMGYASVLNIAGIRIGGVSGIYKDRDYLRGHFECSPYDNNSIRSVYHVRNLEIFRLKQLSEQMDIFISHDWPRGIYHYGNVHQLLKRKPFFKDEIESDSLGSRPNEELLARLRPSYWFAAHMHCKFAAVVPHELSEDGKSRRKTKFLALDKCLPRRRFLQVFDMPHDTNKNVELSYDLEWLTILYLTNSLLNVKKNFSYMPGPGGEGRVNYTPTNEEKEFVLKKFDNDLTVPNNFVKTAEVYNPENSKGNNLSKLRPQTNPQTEFFCDKLGIDDPLKLILISKNYNDDSFNTSFLTPDHKNELSNNSNISDNASPIKPYHLSFVPRSVELNSSKRVSMALPEPKLTPKKELRSGSESPRENETNSKKRSSSDTEGDSSTISLTPNSESSVKSTTDKFLSVTVESDSSSQDLLQNSDDCLFVVDTEGAVKQPSKKFKRRNVNIYGKD